MSDQDRLVELRALLKTALEVVSEIVGAGEDSRPSLPVAPDGPADEAKP